MTEYQLLDLYTSVPRVVLKKRKAAPPKSVQGKGDGQTISQGLKNEFEWITNVHQIDMNNVQSTGHVPVMNVSIHVWDLRLFPRYKSYTMFTRLHPK